MSTNKKWYFLKFKENYFEHDNIVALESLENGYIYSLIILKLYLKSLKHDGQLKMTHQIPYTADKINFLAKAIHHDTDHVMRAINSAKELGLITITETKEIFMTELQDLIGHGSSEAERKQKYRLKQKEEVKQIEFINNGTLSANRPPEIRDRDRDKIIKINNKEKLKYNSLSDFTKDSPLPVKYQTNDYLNLIENWIEYKKEIKDLWKTTKGFKAFINKFESFTFEEIKTAMNNAMSANYRDIFPKKDFNNNSSPKQQTLAERRGIKSFF
jgi:predicted phage replisome organizer